MTQEQARHLLEIARGERLGALYVLAINTGMRQGELLALNWDDVDFERGVLRVRRTLTTNAVTALKAHLSRQLQEMESMGSLYQPGGLIFATETGTIINLSNLLPDMQEKAAKALEEALR